MWVAFALLGTLVLAYGGFMLFRRSETFSPLIDGWSIAAINIVTSLLCISAGLLRREGRARVVPIVLGAGLLSWALGDLMLTIESLGGATPPTPSPADAFYLAFFPLAYVGIVLFMRGEVRSVNTPSWLDSVVAALGASALCATFAFHSILTSAGGTTLEVATNLAYPVGDLLLLGLVVGATTMLAGRRKAPWILLAAGMALNAAGDTMNLFSSTVGATHTGALVNGVAWPAAILLVAMAMWLPAGHTDPLVEQRTPGFLLPGIASACSLAILIYGTLTHPGFVAVGLAAATLAVVGVRLGLSARALRALTRERSAQAVTDALTGLGNRRYLFNVLEAYFAEHGNDALTAQPLAFLFIDLDRFKEINDAFGHPTGDRLLRQLGCRFRQAVRSGDALVRLGGDEFAAVVMDADVEAATAIAQNLADTLEEPFELESVSVRVGASIGIAHAPAHAADSDTLVACADLAMYRAKMRGESVVLYEEGFDGGDLLQFAKELRVALSQEELVLYYQPQLDLRNDEVLAVEALLRWRHPRLGLLAPAKFLSVAEQAGLMGELTAWVLDHALEQCAQWRAGGSAVAVSVNISATNLLDGGFTELVRGMLERHRLPPEALVLEITETSLIREVERSRTVVQELSDMGLIVSIDDFGTGFTSMAYLSGLAARELKLDRSFVKRLGSDADGRDVRLVRSTVDLGHALEMRVVAEGIEDAATLDKLRELGCDVVQGYFVGMPAPVESVTLGPGLPPNGTAQALLPAP